ncbi:MAG: WYL domain-containing protein [Gemmatimonadota bacterium]|nr:WYL domain-containing protein [Gemmatimonadota bacterium]
MPEAGDKTQRLLDLIAYLVGRRTPAVVEEILDAVPAYATRLADGTDRTRDAVRRMFERDKEELRDLGVPLETVPFLIDDGATRLEGYVLRAGDFYLPYLRVAGAGAGAAKARRRGRAAVFDIAAEEAETAREALRRAASLPAFPFRRAADAALRKLTFDLEGGVEEGGVPVLYAERDGAEEVRRRVETLSEALLARKRVRFRYHGIHRGAATERDVAPYGLMFQHGNWYLVGHDALRDDVRLFRVGRMETPEPSGSPPSVREYEIPDDFTLDAWRDRRAWELGAADDPALEARVRFAFPRSLWAERNGLGTLVRQEEGGAQVRGFRVVQPDPFLRWILGLAGEARIEDPPELAEGLTTLARDVAAVHAAEAARG